MTAPELDWLLSARCLLISTFSLCPSSDSSHVLSRGSAALFALAGEMFAFPAELQLPGKPGAAVLIY